MEFTEAVQGKPSEKKISDFSYEAYRESQLWRTVEKSIEELAENQDINLTTKKDHFFGTIFFSVDINDQFQTGMFQIEI